MDYSNFFFGDEDDDPSHQQPQPSPKKELQLQGPRPSPLRVAKESRAIRKPPRHPLLNRPPPPAPPPQPVIIYAVSPKVIHVDEGDFMSLVQRLTGLSPSGVPLPSARVGDLSPAARFASIEKASPRHRPTAGSFDADIVFGNQATTSSATEGFDLAAGGRGNMPGILSPAPSSLPTIPSGIFSPVVDPPAGPLFQDLILSPLLQGGSGFMGGGGGFMSSPSAWFSSTMISPSPTSLDLYNLFADL
ncbi:hypothetical protein MLD38_021496 [Melastoma candidum]|uniref:Uncharacterized protein n=1 Tax=Melastoma candidum TaxID=119954 RepID=A0ACB9QI40_9MYRT|nr:hypothetical protein MLD38_021496 [Melastoma candidum]